MTTNAAGVSEYNAIANAVQPYFDGARSGKGDAMKPAFHEDATIFGYVGNEFFAGRSETLFLWNDENGQAAEPEARIASIDVVGTVATVRLELENWTGFRFTDMFALLKVEEEWKIMNKLFHAHV